MQCEAKSATLTVPAALPTPPHKRRNKGVFVKEHSSHCGGLGRGLGARDLPTTWGGLTLIAFMEMPATPCMLAFMSNDDNEMDTWIQIGSAWELDWSMEQVARLDFKLPRKAVSDCNKNTSARVTQDWLDLEPSQKSRTNSLPPTGLRGSCGIGPHHQLCTPLSACSEERLCD